MEGDFPDMNFTLRHVTFAALIWIGALAAGFSQDESTPAPAARQLTPDTVVYTVNGAPVTQAQVELYFVQYMTFYGDDMQSVNQESYQKQAALQSMKLAVKGALIRQLGEARGLSPTPEQIEKTRRELYLIMGVESPEQFDEIIKQSGIENSEVDTYIRTHLVNLALLELHSRDNPTTVTRAMAKIFYDSNPELHHRPANVQLRQIVILAAGLNATDKAAKRAVAEESLKKLRDGADFAAVAAEVSDDPMGKQGGLYGWVAAKDLVPVLAEAAFALEPGQISGILETDVGFHILKSEGKRPEEDLSFERVAPALIPQLKAHMEKSKYQDWLEFQVSDAEIVNLLEPEVTPVPADPSATENQPVPVE